MENSKSGNEQGNKTLENPNCNGTVVNEQGESTAAAIASTAATVVDGNDTNNQSQGHISSSTTARTPFTNLSQVDADLALARTLQEQERAYMMLRMHGDGSDYGSWEGEGYTHEDDDDVSEEEYDGSDDDDDGEDAFDVHAHAEFEEDDNPDVELDAADFPSDEAYARALQDAEDREMAARLLALARINEMVEDEAEDAEDHGATSQDTWEDVDPDELSYEELIALGEVVGTESRGLSADSIASLPSISYKAPSTQDGSNDTCVICRLDYEDGETLTVLSCKHSYHKECINNWLQINKVCPVCSAEVSTSANS